MDRVLRLEEWWSVVMMTRVRGSLYWVGLFTLLWTGLGCRILPDGALSSPADQVIYRGFDGPPRVRFGSYPSSNIGTFFLGPNLGTHGYTYRPSEKDGIAYTCRGGHIDIIHVRIAADWTAYLAAATYRHLMDRDTTFSCKLAVDRSRTFVTLTYPENWDRLSALERMRAAKEVALALGPYLTFTLTTWHEMLTWYGFKCMGPFPEFPSAFSWEDSYSNLLGTIVGIRALQDSQHKFNRAVELAIDEQMHALGIQPARVARQASESVRGKWFTGNIIFHVEMKKRNFDIGLQNGYITPTLVPGVSACPDAQPVPLPVPTLEALIRHGFSAKVEIEPHEWESDKILRVVYGDQPQKRIIPEEHFALIMDDIRWQATARYGPEYSPERDLSPAIAYTSH
jgi:hypothetical protein